jgi:hypothetical protein
VSRKATYATLAVVVVLLVVGGYALGRRDRGPESADRRPVPTTAGGPASGAPTCALVTAYGATPDDDKDDTRAIQAAIDAKRTSRDFGGSGGCVSSRRASTTSAAL